MIVEVSPETLKSLTQLLPEFKSAYRYNDLKVLNESTIRRIELHSALHVCKRALFKPANLITTEQLRKLLHDYYMRKQGDIPEEMAQRLHSGKDIRTMRRLKKLDFYLRKMDFDVYIEFTRVGINVTGNPSDQNTGNNRIIELGFKEQSTRLIKTQSSFSVISFGVQVTTFYSILHVYRFFASYTRAVKAYWANFELQTKP